jgi:hypothetical protein
MGCIFYFSSLGSKLFGHLKMGITWMIRLSPYKGCLNVVLRKHRIISEIKKFIFIGQKGFLQNLYGQNVLNGATKSIIKSVLWISKRWGLSLSILHDTPWVQSFMLLYLSNYGQKYNVKLLLSHKKHLFILKQQRDWKANFIIRCDTIPTSKYRIAKFQKYHNFLWFEIPNDI